MGGSDGQGAEQAGATQGRARDLSRTRTVRPRVTDTGRRHHIGSAPAVLPVLREDGSVGATHTSRGQLADLTERQLTRLADRLESEMRRAAAAADYEEAADRRDEVAAVRQELQRRAGA